MRERTLFIAIIVAIAALWARPALAAANDTGAEHRSFQRVNEERAARGLPSVRLHSRMTSIARQHSARMAADGELRHNDDLPSQVGAFRALGENVGYGGDADSVHEAFMNSSSHRHIILGDRYTHVGIGAVLDGEIVWITQVFYTPERAASTSRPAREPVSRERIGSPQQRTVVRSAHTGVQAQGARSVRPVSPRARSGHRAQRAISRTVSMLEVMVAIDEPIARRRFVAQPAQWA